MSRGVLRRELPLHGTKNRYDHGLCRCAECRAAKAEYERKRRRLNAYGKNPWVDAAPVRRHVRRLMAPYQGSTAGIGYERIADLAGISRGIVRGLLYGVSGRGPSKRIHKDNASKILAITPADRLRAGGATVASKPVIQMVECLVSFGVSKRRIAFALGTRYPGMRFGEQITVKRARDIADLHWSLWRRRVAFRRQCECPLPRDVEAWLEAS